jgi:hypothetical protein
MRLDTYLNHRSTSRDCFGGMSPREPV